jgi:hypothetical protein
VKKDAAGIDGEVVLYHASRLLFSADVINPHIIESSAVLREPALKPSLV